jgi:hypothetical protein
MGAGNFVYAPPQVYTPSQGWVKVNTNGGGYTASDPKQATALAATLAASGGKPTNFQAPIDVPPVSPIAGTTPAMENTNEASPNGLSFSTTSVSSLTGSPLILGLIAAVAIGAIFLMKG